MKKQYKEPTLNTIRINGTQLLAESQQQLTGGESGNRGDAAESKQFTGGLLEEESVNDKWY